MDFVESSNLELKQKVDNFNEIAKAVCGFANADGGKIVIGVSNNGEIIGISDKDIDSLQQRLDGAIQTVSPVPLHKIKLSKEQGKSIIVVEIYKIGEGAFCTYGGIVYYRFGNITRKMEGKTFQDFLVHRRILSFDEAQSDAGLNDLDDQKIMDYLELRSPEFRYIPKNKISVLSNLRVIKDSGKIIYNTALLLFGKNSYQFLSQNEVKLVRFKGTLPIEIIDSKFVHGTLLENIKEAQDFISRNTKTSFEIKALQRKELPEYPIQVTREALVNAIVHRDYFSKDATQVNIFDNRLEVINPGGLPQGLSLKLLGTLSIQRNPLIYRLLRDIKFVEGLATGIPRMRKGMQDQNLPEPVFEDLGSFFKVTLYNSILPSQGILNLRQQKALSYIQKNKSITSQTYAKLTSVSRVTAVSDLSDMINKKILQKVGKTRSAYYIPSP